MARFQAKVQSRTSPAIVKGADAERGRKPARFALELGTKGSNGIEQKVTEETEKNGILNAEH